LSLHSDPHSRIFTNWRLRVELRVEIVRATPADPFLAIWSHMLHPANMGRYADERAPHDSTLEPATRPRAPRRRLLIRVLVAAAAAAMLLVGGTAGLFLERQP
jgi:hypothetical protein